MRNISLIFVFTLSFLSISCKKAQNANCNITPENEAVECIAQDTASSVNGFVIIYYSNGIDKKSEGNYTSGTPTGFWKYYYPNGNVKQEGNYTNGKADGYWNVFYENGNIRSEGTFDKCKRQGFWKYSYESENYAVQFEGNYDKDLKVGDWNMYNLDGTLETQHNCN